MTLMTSPIRNTRQATVFAWGSKAFGREQMNSPRQRGLRFMEEAIELAQALDVDLGQLHKLLDYVYGRPKGEPAKELGGVGVTMLALAQCLNLSAEHTECVEVRRILAEPIEKFTARNQDKNDAGFVAKEPAPDKLVVLAQAFKKFAPDLAAELARRWILHTDHQEQALIDLLDVLREAP